MESEMAVEIERKEENHCVLKREGEIPAVITISFPVDCYVMGLHVHQIKAVTSCSNHKTYKTGDRRIKLQNTTI